MTTRPTTSAAWSAPVNLGTQVNSTVWDATPCISSDGLSLYFESDRVYEEVDIWVATRQTIFHSWGTPTNLGLTVNGGGHDGSPSLSPNGLILFFASTRQGSYDVWMTVRATTSALWGTPVNAGLRINSYAGDGWSAMSADASTLYFASNRPDGYGGWDGWQVPVFYEPTCGDDDHPYPEGDVNQDCRVDWIDIAAICENWLEDNNP